MAEGGPTIGRVLIVDDDPYFLRALERAFAQPCAGHGGHVSLARNADEAVDRVRRCGDIGRVVFDVCMPTPDDSRSLLHRLGELGCRATLIAMSGQADRRTVFDLARLGVSAFLEKMDVARDPSLLFRAVPRRAAADDPLVPIESAARSLVGTAALPDVRSRVVEAMYDEALRRGGSKGSAAKLLGVHRQAVQNHERRR